MRGANASTVALGTTLLGACFSSAPSLDTDTESDPSTSPGASSGGPSSSDGVDTEPTADAEASADTTAGECDAPSGEPDPGCGGVTPFCDDGRCVGCDALADGASACAELDATAPICDAGLCVACTEHQQCSSRACRIATGECFAPQNRLWVDNAAAGCNSGSGSEAAPVCQIKTAIDVLGDQLATEPWAIIVAGSAVAYGGGLPVELDHPVALIGPDEGLTATIEIGPTTVANLGTNAPELYIAGVTLVGGAPVLAGGSDCAVWLDDAALKDSETGIETNGCAVRMRRTVLTDLTWVGIHVGPDGELHGEDLQIYDCAGGLNIEGSATLHRSVVRNNPFGGGAQIEGGRLTVVDSILHHNQSEGTGASIRSNDGGFDVLYSTVVGDVACLGEAAASTIRNSIVLAHLAEDGLTCTSSQVDRSVVNAGADQGEGNVVATTDQLSAIFDDPTNGGDYHVIPGSLPMDVAVWIAGDPAVDIDGDPRPDVDGTVDWAGADVP